MLLFLLSRINGDAPANKKLGVLPADRQSWLKIHYAHFTVVLADERYPVAEVNFLLG